MKKTVWLSTIAWAALSAAGFAQPAEPASDSKTPPAFDVQLLDGKSLKAVTIKSLTRDAVDIEGADGPSSVLLSELEQLRAADAAADEGVSRAVEARLQNGTVLGGDAIRITKRIVEVTTPLGLMSFPVSEVRSLRLAATDEKLTTAWTEISSRESKNDLLVVRKGDALDFVAGVVGDVSEKDVKLLVQKREVTVPRERVFGVVYVAQGTGSRAVCEVQLASGDRLRASEISLAGDQLLATLGSQAKAAVPLRQVTLLDFTLGKVKSLSDLPMTQSQFAKSPLLTAATFAVRTNRTSLGDTLRIGDREFPRGLWLHSGTSAVFRLGRDYRRLTATVGLDSNSHELARVAPSVKLVILGDGQEIYRADVAWDAAAKAVEVDVAGVRELEVRVEPSRDTPGILEHLVLGEPRVIR